MRHCRVSRISIGLLVIFALLPARAARAQDSYYRIPIQKLTITEGVLPTAFKPESQLQHFLNGRSMQPYAVLDDAPDAECYLAPIAVQQMGVFSQPLGSLDLIVHVKGKPARIAGILTGESEDNAGRLRRLRFNVDPAAYAIERAEFQKFKLAYYRDLRDRNIAGAAWFRHQEKTVARELGDAAPPDPRAEFRQFNNMGRGAIVDISDTFDFFGGGRAVSENLQLDRALMPSTQPAERMVDLDTLTGITAPEMDWAALTKNLKPTLDPLASIIPADQHALLFPTFEAAVKLVDKAQQHGTVLLIAAESHNDDAMTQQRYERQLCIGLGTFGRLIGPRLVNSVAVTGSDAYLRVGSDVAILFETANPSALLQLIGAQVALARQMNPSAKAVDGQIENVHYTGAMSADRSICSYTAALGNAVVVTNSLAQLQRLIATQQGKSPALAASLEYVFFRDRYKRDDPSETAFLMLTDATLRRWCGPKWRIADSRRTRAAAILSDLQAGQAQAIVMGTAGDTPLTPEFTVNNLGNVRLTPGGVASSTYGTLDFMTPIVETDLNQVTINEATSYQQWRNSYQSYWRWFFDPIACRLSINDDHTIAADLSIMPLIAGTEYRQFITITQGATLKATSGDAHDGVIGHLALAINPDSDTIRGYGRLLQNISGNLRIEPLAWLGSSVAVYADDDPFWNELLAAENADDFMAKNWKRLPVALYAESRDPLRLAAFLTALHAFADQSAPNLTKWEPMNYGDHAYVRISANQPAGAGDDLPTIYYTATPKALILTLNEDLLKRAMDRQFAPTTQPAREWLGGNVGVRIERKLLDIFEGQSRNSIKSEMQAQAWANIPILNEWKRLFPDKDPLEVHRKLFQVRLVDPAGGSYTWNDQWKTMQSANYGHPGEPKEGPTISGIFGRIGGSFGLTFENNGLRARAKIEEQPRN